MRIASKLIPAALSLALAAPAAAQGIAGNIAEQARQDYLARAAFPPWSQPVSGPEDPLAAEREPTRQSLPGPDGAAPALQTWASSIRAERGQTVDLYARLDWLDADQADLGLLSVLEQSRNTWTIRAELIGSNSGSITTLDYRDDGRGADALAGDGIHSARFELPAAHQPATGEAQNVMVRLSAENAAGERRTAVGGFLYSHPGAELTGRFRQRVQNGNLVLLAEADVLTAGRYHLAGTLSQLGGSPVATAQQAWELEPGRHWLALEYYGLIFHRLALATPLEVSSLTLTTANGMPNALGPLEQYVFRLPAPPLDELTAEAYNDPDLLQAAERLTGSLPSVDALPR